MRKIRRNITAARVFQVLFYVLSFPLLLHLVLYVSLPLIENAVIGTGTQDIGFNLLGMSVTTTLKYFTGNAIYGIYICAALWIVLIIAQLICKAIKKNRWARAAVVALIAVIIIVGPIFAMDFIGKKEFEKIRTSYRGEVSEETADSYDIGSYESHIVNYRKNATDNQAAVEKFLRRYDIEYSSKIFGGVNTDKSPFEYNKENDAYYSLNGMYADGYVFGYKSAKKVLKDYYGIKAEYEAKGKDIEAELKTAMSLLDTNPNSDWNKYKAGAPADSFSMKNFAYIDADKTGATDEYKKAYGPNGSATKFFLTEEKVNALLSVLGGTLGANPSLNQLKPFLEGFLGGKELKDILNSSMTIDSLVELVNNFGLGGTLMKLIDPNSTETTITKLDVLALLAGFSSYQSPVTYPQMYFLSDENLKTYAYAKYYGQVHGAKVAAVLIPSAPSDGVIPARVGKISLDSKGNVEEDSQTILAEIADFERFENYAPKFYPLFTVRQVFVKWGGLAVFALFISYVLTIYIDRQYKKLEVKGVN